MPTPYIGDVEGQYAPNITYEANSKLIYVSGINAEKTTEEYQDDYYILENNHLKKIAGTVKTIKK